MGARTQCDRIKMLSPPKKVHNDNLTVQVEFPCPHQAHSVGADTLRQCRVQRGVSPQGSVRLPNAQSFPTKLNGPCFPPRHHFCFFPSSRHLIPVPMKIT